MFLYQRKFLADLLYNLIKSINLKLLWNIYELYKSQPALSPTWFKQTLTKCRVSHLVQTNPNKVHQIKRPKSKWKTTYILLFF